MKTKINETFSTNFNRMLWTTDNRSDKVFSRITMTWMKMPKISLDCEIQLVGKYQCWTDKGLWSYWSSWPQHTVFDKRFSARCFMLALFISSHSKTTSMLYARQRHNMRTKDPFFFFFFQSNAAVQIWLVLKQRQNKYANTLVWTEIKIWLIVL